MTARRGKGAHPKRPKPERARSRREAPSPPAEPEKPLFTAHATTRLAARDRARVRDLVEALVSTPYSMTVTTTDWFLPQLSGLLEGIGVSYGLRIEAHGVELSDARAGRHTASVARVLERYVTGPFEQWATYNPLRPEPAQRNRALTSEDLRRRHWTPRPVLADLARVLDLSVPFAEKVRVLSCDGDTLLGWFGCLRDAPFTARERALLQHLAEPLRTRLVFERHFTEASLNAATLAAVLETVPTAAFVTSAEGGVRHANAAGRALLDNDARGVTAALVERVRRGHNGDLAFDLTPICSAGLPLHYVVVLSRAADDPAARASIARTRWGLTPREGEVLVAIAAGAANKAAAARLGCAESTVEFHVSRILAKANAESRAALVRKFWTEL